MWSRISFLQRVGLRLEIRQVGMLGVKMDVKISDARRVTTDIFWAPPFFTLWPLTRLDYSMRLKFSVLELLTIHYE